MCGNSSRPSSGGRIAVMFPSASTTNHMNLNMNINPYTLFFYEGDRTTAIFRIEDPLTRAAFHDCESIDLRIERHGDLTSALTAPPLHQFRLRPSYSRKQGMTAIESEMAFELPEKLDLGVSEKGIVGRTVTVVAEGRMMLRMGMGMGMGVVGYD
ncbi:uncharacterized protein ACLA_020880 [Aspergillus clavatus NRRL 1]|uniref:Uncharacterized protein n=1 Tax=Aspergillus clavatus (strain ATCC 1007 / CBS 513.65 / DSM 816 / NCTC 3887 / NRRL 1 / QM 1276 / 107) TaxID=344612 RepID=A1CP09_ASPCL|nr:uncharacterized protein ACLA_020880 [Aspergillus clavatus NRRL 1]EAW07380.1 conserved hypothetical protein [Aspergillus clavatus NRRL 1]